MNKYFRFSARAVTTCYVLFSLLALACFSIPLWVAWQEFVEQDWRHILHADSERLQRICDEEGIAALSRSIESRVGSTQGDSEDIVLLTDASLHRLAGNLTIWPQTVSADFSSGRVVVNLDGRSTQILAKHITLNNGFHLLVAHDINRYRVLENMFIVGLSGSGAIVIFLGVIGGVVVRRSLLAKVKDINQAASAIMQGDLSHRLPHNGEEDELGILVETENRMLEQIEQLMDGVRNVSNSIAHDLRTPLAELRSRLEELALGRPEEEWVMVEIEGAISDVDRVIAIFNALLRLVEIDSGARRSGFASLNVTELVEDVVDFYLPAAESHLRSLSFEKTPSLTLSGDALLIVQAVGNLIDNAFKYVPKDGTVKITCGRTDNGAIFIEVSDNGPGIAAHEISKVQERFYRCDASRASAGVGLGLSVVAAVGKLHGGKLELSDNMPGLRAVLVLRTTE